MHNTRINYGIGDRVAYRTFGGASRIVEVTFKCEDIKNGRAGFDGLVVNGTEAGMSVWGYDDQIIATTARPDGVR